MRVLQLNVNCALPAVAEQSISAIFFFFFAKSSIFKNALFSYLIFIWLNYCHCRGMRG